MGRIKFPRRSLYEEIWKIGAIKFAKKYSLHYQKLIKTCKENNIPLPNNKYWGYYYLEKMLQI